MSETRSFYLSNDVLAVLDQWPRRERSRTVNAILQKYLRPPGALPRETIDEARVRELIREMLGKRQAHSCSIETDETEKARATSALAAILGMREDLEP